MIWSQYTGILRGEKKNYFKDCANCLTDSANSISFLVIFAVCFSNMDFMNWLASSPLNTGVALIGLAILFTSDKLIFVHQNIIVMHLFI